MMISEQDLKLKLILGLPIEINRIKIHSVKVREIAEFGYLKYNQALKIFSADSAFCFSEVSSDTRSAAKDLF